MYCDLHIHSCLSPCAENDMTPQNIAGMAFLKGLQCIAVTDHNAAFNLPAVQAACDTYGVALLPGMELCTKEEAHLLGYFPTMDAALQAGAYFYDLLPDVQNRPALFGEQLVKDADDETVGVKEKLLLSALPLSLEAACADIRRFGGVYVPAHINRGSNGLLQCLGFLPPDPPMPVLEVSPQLPMAPRWLQNRLVLHSSDAHRLGDVAEKDFTLPDMAGGAFAAIAEFFTNM